jgi:hypothetical protein
MFVNPIGSTTQVSFQEAAANAQLPPNPAQNGSAKLEDTVTLSPAAQALQNEQQILAAAAQNTLSPAAQAQQAEQQILATAAQNRLSPAGESAAALWRSALAAINE